MAYNPSPPMTPFQVLTCNLCENVFLNYGSFVSHVCYGPSPGTAHKAKFCCRACTKPELLHFIEFQFHVRKTHNICEVCLEVSEKGNGDNGVFDGLLLSE